VTTGTPISRRMLGALLGVPLALKSASAADPLSALRSAGQFALIRHAAAPGTLDPPGFRLGDCATQRNLSDGGRAQAVRMGDLLRSNGIATAQLYSSQWCRCHDTATLMKLGEVAPQPLLNFFTQDRTRHTEALRAWIIGLDLTRPTLLVTHQAVIAALVETSAGDGEIVVMRRDADGRLVVQGRQPTA
jgi:broad specificity phosphatase PhoE